MNPGRAGRPLALNGSLGRPLFWLVAITLVVFSGIAVALSVAETHGMHDAKRAVFLVPAIAAAGLLVIALMLRRAGVMVDRDELVVNTGMSGKRVSLASLRAHGLRVVDLNERTELKPVIRLWGTGLPGFAAGWFRLRNGEKAVCLLLDRSRVCYLRSDDGLALLLSLEHPETLRALLGGLPPS